MKLIGRPGSRYVTESYPERSPAFTSMTRFTPTFQTANGDANIGADGKAGASYWIVGDVLYAQGRFGFSGAGLSAGTGSLLLPFPPGITDLSIDVEKMPFYVDIPGPPHLVESLSPVHVSGQIGVTTGSFFSAYLNGQNLTDAPPTLIGNAWSLDTSGLTDGNEIYFDYALPLH